MIKTALRWLVIAYQLATDPRGSAHICAQIWRSYRMDGQ